MQLNLKIKNNKYAYIYSNISNIQKCNLTL